LFLQIRHYRGHNRVSPFRKSSIGRSSSSLHLRCINLNSTDASVRSFGCWRNEQVRRAPESDAQMGNGRNYRTRDTLRNHEEKAVHNGPFIRSRDIGAPTRSGARLSAPRSINKPRVI